MGSSSNVDGAGGAGGADSVDGAGGVGGVRADCAFVTAAEDGRVLPGSEAARCTRRDRDSLTAGIAAEPQSAKPESRASSSSSRTPRADKHVDVEVGAKVEGAVIEGFVETRAVAALDDDVVVNVGDGGKGRGGDAVEADGTAVVELVVVIIIAVVVATAVVGSGPDSPRRRKRSREEPE